MTGHAQRGHFERPTGADLIAAERARQVEQEGWTPEHDAEHDSDALARAAVCYALPERDRGNWVRYDLWPWEERYWKPSPGDRIRELVKAGALIAAEIDRLQARAGNAHPSMDGSCAHGVRYDEHCRDCEVGR